MADEYEYMSVISDKKKEADRLMNAEQMGACNIAIHTASVVAGAAGAIPTLVADALPITGAQVTMAIALGNIFEQKLSDSAAKALVSAAATTFVGRTLIKLIPIAGWIASAGVAAGVTEAIGWTLAVDFAKEYKKNHRNGYIENTVISQDEPEDEVIVICNEESSSGADEGLGDKFDKVFEEENE